jgi:hypothetical protein
VAERISFLKQQKELNKLLTTAAVNETRLNSEPTASKKAYCRLNSTTHRKDGKFKPRPMSSHHKKLCYQGIDGKFK